MEALYYRHKTNITLYVDDTSVFKTRKKEMCFTFPSSKCLSKKCLRHLKSKTQIKNVLTPNRFCSCKYLKANERSLRRQKGKEKERERKRERRREREGGRGRGRKRERKKETNLELYGNPTLDCESKGILTQYIVFLCHHHKSVFQARNQHIVSIEWD